MANSIPERNPALRAEDAFIEPTQAPGPAPEQQPAEDAAAAPDTEAEGATI